MMIKLLQTVYHNTFFRFIFVGGLGFLTNASILYFLKAEINLIAANTIAYFIAVTVTWVLNRLLTFHSHDPGRSQEWLRYVVIYIITGGLQVLIFTLLTEENKTLYLHPLYALIITAIVIALINYNFSKRFAFIRKIEPDVTSDVTSELMG